jgi:uncharacterized protein
MHYKERTLTPYIPEFFDVFPIVTITGPRQAGKSTLLTHYMDADENWRYYSLDDRELLLRIKEDPQLFVKTIAGASPEPPTANGGAEAAPPLVPHLVIDEAQKAPELFHALKLLVDSGVDRKIILSGSANFLLLQSITESLAGRAGILELFPFSLAEALEIKPNRLVDTIVSADTIESLFSAVSQSFARVTDRQLLEFIFYGGYPKIYNLTGNRARQLWFKNYVATYIERDLRDLAQVGDIDTFQHIYRLLSFASGNILNMSTLAGNTGVSVQTVKRYISILRTSFLCTLLTSYHFNQRKQITKAPKLFCFDTGLMNYFLKNDTIDKMTSCMQWRAILETHVFSEIYKETTNTVDDIFIYYWRTSNGAEVDFVLAFQDKLVPIEVKGGMQIKKQSLRGLKSFMATQDAGRVPFAIVLYRGEDVVYLDKNILGVPLTAMF